MRGRAWNTEGGGGGGGGEGWNKQRVQRPEQQRGVGGGQAAKRPGGRCAADSQSRGLQAVEPGGGGAPRPRAARGRRPGRGSWGLHAAAWQAGENVPVGVGLCPALVLAMACPAPHSRSGSFYWTTEPARRK